MIDAAWGAARRVLAVRLDNLGDVLVTTPALAAIRAALPDAHLALLASPVGTQVGQLQPAVDAVVTYEAPWVDPWCRLPHDPDREQRVIATLREQQFDGAIIFTSFRQSALPAAYLCYLAGIPLRAAASIDGPGSLLTTRHRHPERMMHEVERGLDLVGALGITPTTTDLVLRVPDAARRAIAVAGIASGPKERPLVVLHPGCSMPARTYPWPMYADVVNLLVERLGARVIMTGSADERSLVAQIIDQLTPKARVATRPLAGELSFPELCATVEAADVTITNNTGPMHIAAAVKTPTVALFALTNPPEQWGPWHVPHHLLNYDVPCRLCYNRVCPYEHDCLRQVTPETVVAAASDLLGATDTSEPARHPVLPLTAHPCEPAPTVTP